MAEDSLEEDSQTLFSSALRSLVTTYVPAMYRQDATNAVHNALSANSYHLQQTLEICEAAVSNALLKTPGGLHWEEDPEDFADQVALVVRESLRDQIGTTRWDADGDPEGELQ